MQVISPTIFLAWCVSGEIPVHQVGNVVLLAVALGEADPPTAAAGTAPGPAPASATAPAPGPAGTPQATRSAWDPPVPVRVIRIPE